MVTLLAEITFTNENSSLWRQHTVNQPFFVLFNMCIHKCGPRASRYELCGPSVGCRWPALTNSIYFIGKQKKKSYFI